MLAGILRRRSVSPHQSNKGLALNVDIDPPPTPWPFAPVLALLAVLSLVALQFILPATHYRHPADPLRTWIPIEELNGDIDPLNVYSPVVPDDLNVHSPENMTANIDKMSIPSDVGKGALLIVMTKETDLRPLFVVLNSTISNTKEPGKLHIAVIVPSSLSQSECMKLKDLFLNVKIQIYRDGYILEQMKGLMTAEGISEKDSILLDLVPFFLSKIFPSFERFVYLESDAVVQGDIEELVELDMQGNPAAAVEDCSQKFEMHFSMDLLEAARQSSGDEKPAVPAQPYEPKTCLFDKGVLVVDQTAWTKEQIMEAVTWWIAMYQRTAESLYSNGHVELPFHLALYQKYGRLDASWSARGSMTYAEASIAKLVHFDKQNKPWHQAKPTNFVKDASRLWWKYISPATSLALRTN